MEEKVSYRLFISDLCVVRQAVPASVVYYEGGTAGQNTAAVFSTTHCFSVGKGCGLWGSSGLPVLELPRSDRQKLC